MSGSILNSKEGTFVIAEAGVNHNGDLKLAETMVEVAATAGADAVKFQTFIADLVVSKYAPKAEYQKKATGEKRSQLEMLQALEIGGDSHKVLMDLCTVHKIHFISSPFDQTSAFFLNDIGMEIIKIPSGEVTNLPYLRTIGSFGKEIILSTGMTSLGEIKDALEILISSGTRREKITLLHCATEYPTSLNNVNLCAMSAMKKAFPGTGIGYSDHTQGIEVSIAAVAMGATVIEKHFTIDRMLPGPDHASSVEPDELEAMVIAIRGIEKALGNGIKKPTDSEEKTKRIVRKSIVARTQIKKGETFAVENLTTKRPGTGISPMKWDEIIGSKANRDYDPDELI